jgi:hypothetical protein
MIGEKEAAGMTYLTYKRVFWARMLAAWERYRSDHPERAAFVRERTAIAKEQIAIWANPELDRRYRT